MRPRRAFGILALAFLCAGAVGDPVIYESGERRDPFIPLISAEGKIVVDAPVNELEYRIEGIIYDPGAGSMALINGEFYREGDRVLDANLISIFKDRVILQQDDEQKEIWIREEILNKGDEKHETPSAA